MIRESAPRVRPSPLLFAEHFLRSPRQTGSLLPSSRFLAGRMLRPIDWEQARVIVEFGSGLGSMTSEILRRMHPKALLLALDTNALFARVLRSSLRDKRLLVRCRSAEYVGSELQKLGFRHADCIVSSLPFFNMDPATREAILDAARSALAPQAPFVLFQYFRVLVPTLEATFGEVRKEYEPLNFPPAHVFHCIKQ